MDKKTKQKQIEPEKVFHREVTHADGSRHRADLGLIPGGNPEPISPRALERIQVLKSLIQKSIIILVLLYIPLARADGDTPAMRDALEAADLNYEQDHARAEIEARDEQIRALQDQIKEQNEDWHHDD